MNSINQIKTFTFLLCLAIALCSSVNALAQSTFRNAAKEQSQVRLQFAGVPSPELLAELADQDFQLLSYIGNHTYVFAVPTERLTAELQSEYWTIQEPGKASLSEKLNEDITAFASREEEILIPITLLLYQKPTNAEWKQLSQAIKDAALSSSGRLLSGRASAATIADIRKNPLVVQIENTVAEFEPLLAETRAMHQVNLLHSESYGLSGEGQVIGIGDVGMMSEHVDFTGRLIMKTDFPTSRFHPEHVAGIMAGAGHLDPTMTGMAPASQIIVDKNFEVIKNTPDYIRDYNMTLTNNSYGPSFNCDRNGKSNILTNELDWQLYNHPQLMHVFAAGNSGDKNCAPYTDGFGSILAYFPVSKNVLTVGNVDLNRQLAYNSSKGPTVDGRIKPEITARGVLTRSAAHEDEYRLASGTSMAAPAVSGVLTLLQERYGQLYPGQAAPGALLKALLCNTADDAGPLGPDFSFGFGIMNGGKAIKALDEQRFEEATIAHASQQTHVLDVPSGTRQLKVMLYWTDPEASPEAEKALVNDLDLSLTDPQGQKVLPLVADPSLSQLEQPARQQVDRRNNIEQITIANPVPGRYNLIINGFDIPMGPQAYVLTYELYEEELSLTYPLGGEPLLPGTDLLLSWEAEPTNSSTFSLEYSTDGGQNWAVIASQLPAIDRNYLWTLPEGYFPNAYFRVRKDGSAQVDRTAKAVGIIPTIEEWNVTAACGGELEISCTPHPQAVGYELWLLKDTKMEAVYYSTEAVMQYRGDLLPGKEYWFAVRIKTAGGQYSQRSIAQKVIPIHSRSITPSLNIISNVSCHGGADGSVEVLIEELGDYDYFWDNGEAGAFAQSLTAGQHWVTITDDQGCETSSSIVLEEPEALTAEILSRPATVEGANGEASINLLGGTAPYQYSWDIDASLNGPIIAELEAGDYEVTVTDANGCSLTQTVEIDLISNTEPAPARVFDLKVFPNPTPDVLITELELKEAAAVEMALFDPLGRQVMSEGFDLSTSFRGEWDLRHLPAGVYWVQLKINEEQLMRKIMLAK